jgi:hypothetical protein
VHIAPVKPDDVREAPVHHASPWLYVAGGIGVVGVGVGATAGVLAMGDKNILESECIGPACSARGKEAADRGKTEAIVSTVAFGVGAAALVTTLIVFLVDRAHGQGSHARSGAPSIYVAGDEVGWRF